MFGELPKLFDRNFAIGFFLPVAIFVTMSVGLFREFNLSLTFLALSTGNQIKLLIGTTIIGLISWLGAVFLLATNRDIIRLMEGYGRFNPARLYRFKQKWNYKRLKNTLEKLDEEYRSYNSEDIPQKLQSKRDKLMQKLVKRFPDEEEWILPTSFGNTMRAFEVYPRVMYGLDAIPGWTRILGVISDDYHKLVKNSKAQVNFWCNLFFLGILFLAEYIGIQIYTGQAKAVWIAFATIGVIFISYLKAITSAIEWGDLVKASFDLFLPDLCKKLGFSLPSTIEQQQLLWKKFSIAVIYSEPDYMPSRDS